MNDIIEKLLKNADLKYKEFHSSLCPNTDNIIGVRIPKLREIAKRNSKRKLQRIYEKHR